MQTSNAFPQSARRRTTFFLLACLGVMVFAAVAYRVEHPSIVQIEEQRQMPGGMGQAGGEMSGISAMMQKLQANPEDIEAMRSLGMAFMEMRAWDKSVNFWDMILERHPDDVMALNQKGFCLFEMENYAEAAELFERMLTVEKDNHHAHFNLGVIYKHYLGQADKAAVHFQAVVDALPEDSELAASARRELSAQ
jgi:tetratricopeptide (TPR) repeat protein